MTTVIMRTATRIVVPIILVVSIALFIQGHNRPGGGFIAGVLTSSAFALIYITYSLTFLEENVLDRADTETDHLASTIVRDYRRVFALGLALAAGSGLAAIVVAPAIWGYQAAFMEQGYLIFEHVPLYGEMELASALAFDLGVYAVVVGALLTILSVVGDE